MPRSKQTGYPLGVTVILARLNGCPPCEKYRKEWAKVQNHWGQLNRANAALNKPAYPVSFVELEAGENARELKALRPHENGEPSSIDGYPTVMFVHSGNKDPEKIELVPRNASTTNRVIATLLGLDKTPSLPRQPSQARQSQQMYAVPESKNNRNENSNGEGDDDFEGYNDNDNSNNEDTNYGDNSNDEYVDQLTPSYAESRYSGRSGASRRSDY